MKIQITIASIVLMSTLFACTNDTTSKNAASAEVGQQTATDSHAAAASPGSVGLPSFSVQDVNGNVVNLQSFRGKKVFVNLWASWCPPCRAEMPSIQKLAQSVDKDKVAFVMLALDDDFEKSKQFIKKQNLQLPIYYPAENLPTLFNVQGIPTTFIFNEEGNLVQRVDGGDDYNTDLYRNFLK